MLFFSEGVKKIPFWGIENIVFSRTMNLPLCVKVREMWQYSLDTSYFSHTCTIKSDYLSRGKHACAPSEESDQPAHPRRLIRVLAWHSVGRKDQKCRCGQRRLFRLRACMYARSDLSLRWAHMRSCRCCTPVHKCVQPEPRSGSPCECTTIDSLCDQ